MPDQQQYTVKDNDTGKTITFRWDGPDPPTETDMADVFAAAKVTASAAPPPAPTSQSPAPQGFMDRLGQAAKTTSDPAVGALKGVANTVIGMGEAAYDYVPGVSKAADLVAGGNAKPMYAAARQMVQPDSSIGQQVGYTGEQIGEFFLPLPGAKAKLAKEVLRSGLLTQAQTGSAPTSALSAGLTAVMPVAGKVAGKLGPALRQSAENTMAKALGATKEVMKSEAAALAPEMLARGVKGSRQAMLDRAVTTSQEVGQRLGALYKAAGEAGQTVPGLVIRGELELAKDALMVPNKTGVKVPIEGAQGVAKQLDDMAAWVETLGDDIPIDHAAKIKTMWDRIVAKAGLYGPKATASATDSEKAWAIREGAGSFRKLLSEASPDIAKLNKEYKFWEGMQDVLEATKLRTQAQQGRGLLAAIGGTTGFFSGDNKGIIERTTDAAGGALAASYLTKALQSAPFRTRVTGPFKNMLANALASGDHAKVMSTIKTIAASLPAQARQALQ